MIRADYARQEAEREAERAGPYGRLAVPGFGSTRGFSDFGTPRYWNVNWA